jgi:hypothetical protein
MQADADVVLNMLHYDGYESDLQAAFRALRENKGE